LLFLKPHYLHRNLPIPCSNPRPKPPLSLSLSARGFAASSSSGSSLTNPTTSFDWSDDENDGEDGTATAKSKKKTTTVDNKSRNLPPPYDPFSKKPVIEEPNGPSNLPEIFHKMRTEGLTNHAVKMFDALSKDGLTHEALELFSVIKDKGSMPDVVAHTAVIEAYANAGGHCKDTLRTFDRMLVSGVSPNAYTYTILIKGLTRDDKLPEAQKYLLEMIGKGMWPNAGTYQAVPESRAIATYVARKYKSSGPDLLREGALQESAMVDQWLEVEPHQYNPAIPTIVLQLIVIPMHGGLPLQQIIDDSVVEQRRSCPHLNAWWETGCRETCGQEGD
ncbi:pentatricopeptide repeat-containing protein At4g16390, chloroplastic-like, partial [Phoenix dactylifera]|uniref:Pentatricopeptide repeat-containing protein At4g16390, chloroplastic-like n=1 Tax=Phoenix dactylifera TaxID=42345 RepID=A0A8B8JAS4_PHODC